MSADYNIAEEIVDTVSASVLETVAAIFERFDYPITGPEVARILRACAEDQTHLPGLHSVKA